jgi:hypothetical protein
VKQLTSNRKEVQLRKAILSLVIVALSGVLLFSVSCDKQKALEQIYNDPVLRQSILERVASDEEMMTSMVDRAFERVDMTEKMMQHFVENKELESKMLDLIIADTTAQGMLVAKIKERSDLVTEIRRRR